MTPLAYAKLGLETFACHYPVINGAGCCSCGDVNCGSAAKHPYPRHAPKGFKSASKDPRAIVKWASGPFNIGVACGTVSGVIVLDIDPRNDGDESLAKLEAEYGPLPVTWRAFTGGGGEHFYFAHPGGHIDRNDFAPGINLKGDGG